jgi:predicted DsbA family dithiol-disulfide isomerase
MKPVLTIDAVSDFLSPWCFIARRRLGRALEQLAGAEPSVRWAPFELHPAIPKQGMALDEYLRGLFGSPDAARPMLSALAEAGLKDGIHFQFDRVRNVPNTRDAHRLVLMAEREGRHDAVAEGLFAGLFEQGRDIGEPGVLAEVAADAGLDAAGVREYLAGPEGGNELHRRASRVRAAGFEGVPAFVFNDRVVVMGPAEPETFLEAIDRAVFPGMPAAPPAGRTH